MKILLRRIKSSRVKLNKNHNNGHHPPLHFYCTSGGAAATVLLCMLVNRQQQQVLHRVLEFTWETVRVCHELVKEEEHAN